MTFIHGKSTQVWLDSLDLTGYLNSFDMSVDVDTADSTVFGNAAKTALAGAYAATVDAQGFYDPLVTHWTPTMLGAAGSIITYGPGGLAAPAAGAGSIARLIPVASTNYAESSPVGGVIGIKYSALADGSVGFGHVIRSVAEGAGTPSPVTSGYVDGLAATTTGWQAHLHVTAVSGAGSWVVKLVDSSASNFSDVADVSGGAFTTTAAVTQQRLVSAAGATLRRYVRCVATRSGGVAGDSITFGVALARNI
jgi:hypothetical protein